MKKSHIIANVLVAIAIAVVFWGIPDDLAWLTRLVLVTTIIGFVGLLVYIGIRFRETPSDR